LDSRPDKLDLYHFEINNNFDDNGEIKIFLPQFPNQLIVFEIINT
jgi:hypothetical protein